LKPSQTRIQGFGKPLKEIQGKTTKTKQRLLKDKQEKHKAKEVKL